MSQALSRRRVGWGGWRRRRRRRRCRSSAPSGARLEQPLDPLEPRRTEFRRGSDGVAISDLSLRGDGLRRKLISVYSHLNQEHKRRKGNRSSEASCPRKSARLRMIVGVLTDPLGPLSFVQLKPSSTRGKKESERANSIGT